MLIDTKYFGEIDIDASNLITFDKGLMAFEEYKTYVLIHDDTSVFSYLQSLDEKNIAFIVVNPYLFIEDYEFEITEGTVKKLSIENPHDVMVYTIAVVPEIIENMTVNLMAPIVINKNNLKGQQIIIDNNKYAIKYKLLKNKNFKKGDVQC